MKRVIFIILTCWVATAFAHELKSFDEIYKSIHAGKNIKMLISLENCIPKPPVDQLHIYTAPVAVMIRKDYLQFANSPLTTNNPQLPKIPVIENVTYRITNLNQVHITARVLTLPSYIVFSETSSMCPLGSAVRVFNK